jgi:hypothetical protein
MKRDMAISDKQTLAVALLCSVYVSNTFPARFHLLIAVVLKLKSCGIRCNVAGLVVSNVSKHHFFLNITVKQPENYWIARP